MITAVDRLRGYHRPALNLAQDGLTVLQHAAWWSSLLLVFPLSAQLQLAPIVGTVLDPSGHPAKDAIVRVSRCDGRSFGCLDLQLRQEWIELANVRSDKSGRFGVQVPAGLALRVEVDLPPFARWITESCVPGEEQKVQLEPACTVTGQLKNAATGKGTFGSLRAWRPESDVELFRGHTDGEGRFRFERLPSGPCVCSIDPNDVCRPDWLNHVLAAGDTWTIDLSLEAGVELTGVVTDVETGQPIAGARVGEGWTLYKAVQSDAAGRYTMRGYSNAGQPNKIDLCCFAPGYSRMSVRDVPPGDGARREDIALERGLRVVGSVVDAHGAPIAGAYVAVIASTDKTVPWLPARTGKDGAFVCDGLPRRAEAVLMIRCYGFASSVYGMPVQPADGRIDVGRIALHSPHLVTGIVRNRDGSIAAGVEVHLHGTNADATTLGPLPSTWWLLRYYAGQRHTRTDANGAYAFGDVAPGAYQVGLGSVGNPIVSPIDVNVEAGKEVPAVQITKITP